MCCKPDYLIVCNLLIGFKDIQSIWFDSQALSEQERKEREQEERVKLLNEQAEAKRKENKRLGQQLLDAKQTYAEQLNVRMNAVKCYCIRCVRILLIFHVGRYNGHNFFC